jgi:hypothetical protein
MGPVWAVAEDDCNWSRLPSNMMRIFAFTILFYFASPATAWFKVCVKSSLCDHLPHVRLCLEQLISSRRHSIARSRRICYWIWMDWPGLHFFLRQRTTGSHLTHLYDRLSSFISQEGSCDEKNLHALVKETPTLAFWVGGVTDPKFIVSQATCPGLIFLKTSVHVYA